MFHKIIRVNREDSAFVYAILESLEGMASFSTLDCPKTAHYRDIALFIPTHFAQEIEQVIIGLRKKMPILEIQKS